MTPQLPRKRADSPTSLDLLHADVTALIIGAFYHVYNALGYGFLESVYANALTVEMGKRGLHVEREGSSPGDVRGRERRGLSRRRDRERLCDH
jgi:hypothetical protein